MKSLLENRSNDSKKSFKQLKVQEKIQVEFPSKI